MAQKEKSFFIYSDDMEIRGLKNFFCAFIDVTLSNVLQDTILCTLCNFLFVDLFNMH